MYETRNDLPQAAREKAIELLAPRMAEAIDLQLQAKQAHWNVKGAHFIALHKLFDDVAEHAEKFVDQLAERIVQLGGIAEGTIGAVSKRSTLRPYPLNLADGTEHVEALAHALAAFGKGVRHAIDGADEIGDKDTADIFLQVSRTTDQQLWFVEAHVQGASTVKGQRGKKIAA